MRETKAIMCCHIISRRTSEGTVRHELSTCFKFRACHPAPILDPMIYSRSSQVRASRRLYNPHWFLSGSCDIQLEQVVNAHFVDHIIELEKSKSYPGRCIIQTADMIVVNEFLVTSGLQLLCYCHCHCHCHCKYYRKTPPPPHCLLLYRQRRCCWRQCRRRARAPAPTLTPGRAGAPTPTGTVTGTEPALTPLTQTAPPPCPRRHHRFQNNHCSGYVPLGATASATLLLLRHYTW